MKPGERIPTPLKHRWRRFRYGVMPGLCFGGCVVLTLWLWRSQGRLPNAVGEVEAVSVPIAAGIDGTLEPRVPRGLADWPAEGTNTWWTRFEPVKQGEVIARLDSAPTDAALAVLRAELIKLEAEIGAVDEQLKLDMLGAPVNLSRAQLDHMMDVERLRLEVVDRQTEITANTIVWQRLNATLGYLEGLAERGITVEMELVDTQLLRDETYARLESSKKALEEVRGQLERAEHRSQAIPEIVAVDSNKILAPVRAEIGTQEALVAELNLQAELLEIKAPFAGTISEVFLWPGQHVRAGDPIVTLAKSEGDGDQYVVSYLRQEQRVRPNKETPVQLRIRMPGSEAMAAKVAEVGPQFEPIPIRYLADPQRPEFGLPVRILLPEKMKSLVHPGELVDVRFPR